MTLPPGTLTTAQAADLLGVSKSTITRLAQAGKLKAYKLNPFSNNSPWRIYRSAIDNLLQQRQPDEKEAATRAGVGG